jgi:hypothetical protein
MKKELEKDVERACLHWLNLMGWLAWKNPTRPAFDVIDGKKVLLKRGKFELVGASDIIAIKNGAVTFIEVKRKGGKQSPGQVAFQSAVERHGGIYVLIESVDELRKVMTLC